MGQLVTTIMFVGPPPEGWSITEQPGASRITQVRADPYGARWVADFTAVGPGGIPVANWLLKHSRKLGRSITLEITDNMPCLTYSTSQWSIPGVRLDMFQCKVTQDRQVLQDVGTLLGMIHHEYSGRVSFNMNLNVPRKVFLRMNPGLPVGENQALADVIEKYLTRLKVDPFHTKLFSLLTKAVAT